MPRHLRLAAAPAADARLAIRVVLGDDHHLVRRNLRLLMEREEGIEVVADAGDLRGVIRQFHGHRPDVVVLDLSVPNGASVEAIRTMRARSPQTQIVVLTMDDDPAFALQAIEAGAIGYVLKDWADPDLLQAVRNASLGEGYVSRRVASLLKAMRASTKRDNLSPREVEVLRLIALGHTSAEIAEKLHLSVRTVETHRSRIHRKLGLSTRAELVRYALRRGLFGS
jgi:two-component system, NarL family, response regulator NreC